MLWNASLNWEFLNTSEEFPRGTWWGKGSLTWVPSFSSTFICLLYHTCTSFLECRWVHTQPHTEQYPHPLRKVDPKQEVCMVPKLNVGPFRQERGGCWSQVEKFLWVLGVLTPWAEVGSEEGADRHLWSAGACTDPSWPGLQEALNPVIVGIKLSVFCSSTCI